ncbi:Acyl-CoA-binding domain-containing protein 6 [Echinococcus granulosus]|uniref:Acyl-CoA-binding domain-containing protein 6 n=1 Tax=Echinococcus granulosus TaxID=6210 RepID=A0A068WVY7_ECHGR|nr:Acyl-CoA-binding domain-containing protein 6 [Echinococcus granulosus]CDS21775.1 acyl coenzyme A binding domain containing protein [Echinococcus granulosus]
MSNPKLEDEFTRATAYVPKIAGSLSSEDLLYLYSRYKQATEGPCSTPKPGFSQYKARQKWMAWKSLGNLPADDAKQQYVRKLTEISPDWSSETSHNQTGPRVSRPVELIDDNSGRSELESTPLIELVKDGVLKPVKNYLQCHPTAVGEEDPDKLTPLHWAVDRGFYDIAVALIECGADINAQDKDKQTPLHYACFCQHRDMAQLLLDRGADKYVADANGEYPSTDFLQFAS